MLDNIFLVSIIKGKGIPYSIRALGPELIPVYRQSARRWHSHKPGSRLPLLSARPAVTFPAREHHRHLAGTKLYCLVTEAHGCEQLAQSRYLIMQRQGVEPATSRSRVRHANYYTTKPPSLCPCWWILFGCCWCSSVEHCVACHSCGPGEQASTSSARCEKCPAGEPRQFLSTSLLLPLLWIILIYSISFLSSDYDLTLKLTIIIINIIYVVAKIIVAICCYIEGIFQQRCVSICRLSFDKILPKIMSVTLCRCQLIVVYGIYEPNVSFLSDRKSFGLTIPILGIKMIGEWLSGWKTG